MDIWRDPGSNLLYANDCSVLHKIGLIIVHNQLESLHQRICCSYPFWRQFASTSSVSPKSPNPSIHPQPNLGHVLCTFWTENLGNLTTEFNTTRNSRSAIKRLSYDEFLSLYSIYPDVFDWVFFFPPLGVANDIYVPRRMVSEQNKESGGWGVGTATQTCHGSGLMRPEPCTLC